MGRVPGFATASGTAAYAAAHPRIRASDGYRVAFGLTLSSVGLGTYLGELDPARDEGYAAAVRTATLGGINVIDTAINYRHQRSERVVGAALEEAVTSEKVDREGLFVATKGGYIPYDADVPDPRRAVHDAYVATGLISGDHVVGGVHCLHPDFLRDQLRRSRENLRLETLDLYYLHNPETQLSELDRGAFQDRMVTAFVALEEAVERGEIRRYGVATWNGLRVAQGAPDHLSLLDLVRAAEEARQSVGPGGHHLAAVQAPLNLSMTEAVRRATQRLPDGSVVPLALACRDLGLAWFTSASILQGRLAVGMPDPVRRQVGLAGSDAQVALQATRSAPEVTCALVGMSSAPHVEEALALLEAHAPAPTGVWGAPGVIGKVGAEV